MAIKTIADLRNQLPADMADVSDEEAVSYYASQKDVDPDFVRRYLGVGRQEPEDDYTNFSRGLRVTGNQAIGTAAGAVGLAADAVGAEGLRDSMFESYQGRMERMNELSRPQDELKYLREEGGAGDWVDSALFYAGRGAGELASGGVAGLVGKQILKRGVSREVRERAREAAEANARGETLDAAQREAVEQVARAERTGFMGGVGAQAVTQQTGAIYGQAGEERIAEGGSLDDVNKLKALGYGVATGGLEFAGDIVLLGAGRFLPRGAAERVGDAAQSWNESGGRLRRMGKGGAAGTVVEGATEVAQTVLEDIGAESEVNFADEQYREKLLQAAFAGAMTGGTAGTMAAGMRGSPDQDAGLDTEPDSSYQPDPVLDPTQPAAEDDTSTRLRDFIDQTLVADQARYTQEDVDEFAAATETRVNPETQVEEEVSNEDFLRRTQPEFFDEGTSQPETGLQTEPAAEPEADPETGRREGPSELREQIEDTLGVTTPLTRGQKSARAKRTKRAIKLADQKMSGVMLRHPEDQVEHEMTMREWLEWDAVRRYNANRPADAPRMEVSFNWDGTDATDATPVVGVGNQQTGQADTIQLRTNTPEYDDAVNTALAGITAEAARLSEAPVDLMANEPAPQPVQGIETDAEQGAADVASTEPVQGVETDTESATQAPAETDSEAGPLTSARVVRDVSLDKIEKLFSRSVWETDVWEALKNLYLRGEESRVVNKKPGKNRVSSLSPTYIAKELGVVNESGKGRVADALAGIRKKLHKNYGINVNDALRQLNIQNRQVVEDEDGAPGLGTEVDVGDLVEAGNLSVTDRKSGVGQAWESRTTARDTKAADRQIRQTENADLDARLDDPQFEAAVAERFARETGKPERWNSMSRTTKRGWTRKFLELDQDQQEQVAEESANERRARESQERHEAMLRAFTADPLGRDLMELYDRAASRSQNPAAKVPFSELSVGYQGLFMERVIKAAANRGEDAGRAAADQTIAQIQQELINEQRTAGTRGAVEERSGPEAIEDQGPADEGGPTAAGRTGAEQQAAENFARRKAGEVAQKAKVTVKKRRVTKGPDGTLYHRNADGTTPDAPMSRTAIEQVVDGVRKAKGWGKDAMFKIVVVDSISDIPGEGRVRNPDEIQGVQRMGDAELGEQEGTPYAYVVAGAHATPLEVEETVIHEVAGHIGNRMLMGDERVWTHFSNFMGLGREDFMELADALGVRAQMEHYEAGMLAEGRSFVQVRVTLFEEMIAFTQQQQVTDPRWMKVAKLIARLRGQARQWMRRHGFFNMANAKFGATEVLALAYRAEKALQSGHPRAGVGPRIEAMEDGYEKANAAFVLEQQEGINLNALEEFGGVDVDQALDAGWTLEDFQEAQFSIIVDALESGRYMTKDGMLKPNPDGWEKRLPKGLYRLREDMRQQESRTLRNANRLLDAVRDGITSRFPGATGALDRTRLGFKMQEQLAYETGFPEIREYVNKVHEVTRARQSITAQGHTIDRTWSSLQGQSRKVDKMLGALMVDTTMAGFDPSVDTATTAEQRGMKRRWDQMDPAAKALYKNVRDHYVEMRRRKIAALEDATTAAELEGGQKLNKLRGDIESMKKIKGPYFPLKRFGGYYVVGMSPELRQLSEKNDEAPLTGRDKALFQKYRKDPKHYRVEGFDSAKEARKRSRELSTSMGFGYYNEAKVDYQLEANEVPDISKIESYFVNSELSKNPAVMADIRSTLLHMYADLLPAGSAVKRQMTREKIAGATENMRRVFADSVVSDAFQISRMEKSPELKQTLNKVAAMGKYGDVEARRAQNEVLLRAGKVYEFEESPVVDSLMTASYFAHLGMSPAYFITNASQVPVVTVPYIGARHGFDRAGNATIQAVKDATDIIVKNYREDGWRMEFKWADHTGPGKRLSRAEGDMLQTLQDRDKLDVTVEHDLSNAAKGAGTSASFTRQGDVLQALNTPVRIIEIGNRVSTGLAAYRLEAQRLARNKKMSAAQQHDAATEYAIRTVNDTQLDYSASNRARLMQSILGSRPAARMAFQFRVFQQGILNLVLRSVHQSVRGKTPRERREARRLLGGLIVSTTILGGVRGAPLAASLFATVNILRNVFGDDDEVPADSAVEIRNYLTEMWGADTAAMVMKGLPMGLGMDISQRVGMGDLAIPLPFMRSGSDTRETVAEMFLATLGAAPNYLLQLPEAAGHAYQGDLLRAVEKGVPVKLVQNLAKAHRYKTEGMTDSRGEPILDAEEFDAMDLFWRRMGFSTRKESDYYEANSRQWDIRNAVESARSDLLREYAQARLAGDSSAAGEVRRKVREFNRVHGDRGVRITGDSLSRAVDYRRRTRRERGPSGVRTGGNYEAYAEDVRFATER